MADLGFFPLILASVLSKLGSVEAYPDVANLLN